MRRADSAELAIEEVGDGGSVVGVRGRRVDRPDGAAAKVAGGYHTVGNGIQQSNSGNSNPNTIAYTFTLAPGQQIGPGTNRRFVAQTGGTGTPHPMSGDTWTVTYPAGGAPVTRTGTF